jgi:hypothetical protein
LLLFLFPSLILISFSFWDTPASSTIAKRILAVIDSWLNGWLPYHFFLETGSSSPFLDCHQFDIPPFCQSDLTARYVVFLIVSKFVRYGEKGCRGDCFPTPRLATLVKWYGSGIREKRKEKTQKKEERWWLNRPGGD